MTEPCKTNEWPIILTGIILFFGIVFFFRSETPVGIADGAQYWASIVSACALVWLVFGFLQQNKSIDAQNRSIDAQNQSIIVQEKQIALYNKELELQRIELKK